SASWARSDARPSSAAHRRCNCCEHLFGLLAARPAGHTRSGWKNRSERIACSYATRNHTARTCPRDRSQRVELPRSRHIAKQNAPALVWVFSDQKSPAWAAGAPPAGPVPSPCNLVVDTSSPWKLLTPAADCWSVTAHYQESAASPVCVNL